MKTDSLNAHLTAPASSDSHRASVAGRAAHTPGPWRHIRNTGVIVSDDRSEDGGCQVAEVGAYRDKELLPFNRDRWDADAARIVECVNACEGMADPALHIQGLRDAAAALADSRRVAEQLAKALRRISGGDVMVDTPAPWTHADVVLAYQRIADAALAAYDGGKP